MTKKTQKINNLVIVSDLHCGCRVGLCPPGRIHLDDGGTYESSSIQKKVWKMWRYFWDKWVPRATQGEPYAVIVNGDSIDGVHHGSTTQISHNLLDQTRIAKSILKPVVELCEGRFYMIRGTEAHVGQSGCEEERLAESLGAIPDEEGRYARYEMWCKVGKGLVNLGHHIGCSGSAAYETTAIIKELIELYAQAGRNREVPPDIVCRSHRHRNCEVRVPTSLGYGISFVTPGWQLRTPFTYRIAMGRAATPQIGGSLIRQGDEDLFTRHKVWDIGRSKVVEAL
jgi:hypothetical protein